MIKHFYSFPKIEDTMDSLNWAVWFTVLDHKPGYWQVKMDKASKPLTAFIVGTLGLMSVIICLFGLVNAQPLYRG